MGRLLQGRRILVTRPRAQAARLAALIAGEGGEPLCFPLIEIEPPLDAAPLRGVAARLAQYVLVVFISPNAVAFAIPEIAAQGPWPEATQAAAIGPGTVSALVSHGFDSDRIVVPAQRFDSEALLDQPALQSARVVGKKVLILRGDGGRELLVDTLRQRGADVDCIACYRRTPPSDASEIVSLLRNKALDAVTLSSSEGLRNLLAMLDTEACAQLRCLPVFVSHQRIEQAAIAAGWREIVVTPPGDARIVESLCRYKWLQHE